MMPKTNTYFELQFFTPVPCPEGWMVIFWDMVTRLMTVINPLYTKKCPHPPTQQLDEIRAWKLHYALFHCLTEYYAGWPASKEGWTLKFPAFAETKFTRYYSRYLFFCVLTYMSCQYENEYSPGLHFLFEFHTARSLVLALSI